MQSRNIEFKNLGTKLKYLEYKRKILISENRLMKNTIFNRFTNFQIYTMKLKIIHYAIGEKLKQK